MHRVTIGGEALAGFPADHQGGYIKLFLPTGEGEGETALRTYTIRRQSADALDIDFALHGGNSAGPATSWALAARPGDSITIGGPGPAKPLPEADVFHLIAGDMSALPAIAANLERASPDACGHAVIEVQDEDDRLPLEAPPGITIDWLVNPEPGLRPENLVGALRDIACPEGLLAGWAACEFAGMRLLRGFLRDELGLRPPHLYISSYWKLGLDEPEHKLVKREDAEAQPV